MKKSVTSRGSQRRELLSRRTGRQRPVWLRYVRRPTRPQKPKGAMRLLGFSQSGEVVYEQTIPLCDYYEESHPVIDSNAFRKKRSLVRLVGTKFDKGGAVEEEWENYYTDSGAITGGVVRDKHGSVIREKRISG